MQVLNRNHFIMLLLICSTIIVTSAMARAQEKASPVELFDGIQYENMLLKEKLHHAELLMKLAEIELKTRELQQKNTFLNQMAAGANNQNGPLPNSVMSTAELGKSSDEPAVVSIVGVDGRLKAKVRLANGHTVNLLPGDDVPATQLKVAAVTKNGVLVHDPKKKKSKKQWLPFIEQVKMESNKQKNGPYDFSNVNMFSGPDSTVTNLSGQ